MSAKKKQKRCFITPDLRPNVPGVFMTTKDKKPDTQKKNMKKEKTK